MGKFFIVCGIILMIGGFAVPFMFTGVAGIPGFASVPGVTEPQATDLCHSDERLEKKSGGSSRAPGTNTYAHSVSYGCIDSKGNRRDVTGIYLMNLGKEAGGFVKNIFGSLFLSIMISLLGFVSLITGVIISIKKRNLVVKRL